MANNIIERDQTIERMPPVDLPRQQGTLVAQTGAPPAERVFGAQQVAVKRDESDLLVKLRTMAAAAGENWYYRFPVKKKVKNEKTGRDEWVRDYVEGPSIKCANNVARLYGNCDIDTRVFDVGDSYYFYARFIDLETGYSLTRPFRQRKGQTTMNTKDPGRAEDIWFQIGASKAIRNVINNALEFFANYAADEAKKSIIEAVGKKLEFYREKVAQRLKEMKIPLKAVETVRGRPLKDWLAADVARTIAELQAIQDGMSSAAETYLDDEPADEAEQPQERQRPATVSAALDQFAEQTNVGQPPEGDATAAGHAPAATAGGGTDDPVRVAYEQGKEAKAKGHARKAVPGEYRNDPKLAVAWDRGWSGEPLN